jgi:hypothetical protein
MAASENLPAVSENDLGEAKVSAPVNDRLTDAAGTPVARLKKFSNIFIPTPAPIFPKRSRKNYTKTVIFVAFFALALEGQNGD